MSMPRFTGVILALVLIFSFVGGFGPLRAQSSSAKPQELSQALQGLSEFVKPAVVQIIATGYAPGSQTAGSAASLLRVQRSTGSGVVLDPKGYIVTNGHVIDGARRIQVILNNINDNGDKRSILRPTGKVVGAQVVGLDTETDLAVLKIEGEGLAWLQLGDSDMLKQGQIVLAYGSPHGLQNSVSMGVISALARQFRPEDPMIYLQTDATINPGNSGGPLVNLKGEVIGINTLIFSHSGGSEGIGFAAPSNIVRYVYQQLRETGRVRRGIIGVNAQTVTPMLAEGLGLSQIWGVILADVYPGSPADRAGIRIGDVILSLDGKTMENGRQFDVNLYGKEVGKPVSIEVMRGPDTLTVQVEVVERSDDRGRFMAMVSPGQNLIPELGILGLDIDQNTAPLIPGLRQPSGVLVASRSLGGGFLAQDNFEPGDVIHSVNARIVRNLTDLREVLLDLRTYDPVVVHVERDGQLRFITFELE